MVAALPRRENANPIPQKISRSKEIGMQSAQIFLASTKNWPDIGQHRPKLVLKRPKLARFRGHPARPQGKEGGDEALEPSPPPHLPRGRRSERTPKYCASITPRSNPACGYEQGPISAELGTSLTKYGPPSGGWTLMLANACNHPLEVRQIWATRLRTSGQISRHWPSM